jgi:protein SCO1
MAHTASRLLQDKPLAVWLAPLFLVMIAAGSIYWAHAETSGARDSYRWFNGFAWEPESKLAAAKNFSLPDQNRTPVSLRQFRGKVAIISFTSSVCHQQCPLVGRSLATVERNLGPLSAKTVLISISIEPEADTRASVEHFARDVGWDPYRWYYLWAALPKMLPIWKAYYVYVSRQPAALRPGRNVVHTPAVVLVDQSGHIRGYMSWPFLPSRVTQGVRALIQRKV